MTGTAVTQTHLCRPGRRGALWYSAAWPALCLAAISLPRMAASASPAPNAQPTGGSVVAGTAAISHTTSTTLIQQSTQRAAINWNSFDVGAQQSVTFQQPSATSSTLNRVVGADPSSISGKITANGQIVIVNQAGVIFNKGAEIDTAGLIATSANITNPNFMSGKMIFDQAGKPNASIINDGTITVGQAGLVGLVAPRVANSGVINAKLGRVVLAGATTHTIDMYGDGLLAIDVTGQVKQAPKGADGKAVTALVTNTGTIFAQGGSVQITAAAADGIVQTLVDAGGKISVGSGRIAIAGTGGSVLVDGSLLADGRGPAGIGGQIAVTASKAVTLTAGAKVSASGAAGGGTIAIGTTIARAAGGPTVTGAATAQQVVVQKGAVIAANARVRGAGGKVTLLATETTNDAGSITARGGRRGGDGGAVEVSGGTLGLTGSIDVSAPLGRLGTILLDPIDLVIATGNTTVPVNATDPNVAFDTSTAGNPGTVTPASLQALQGNVHVEATNNITVNAPVTLTGVGQGLTLEAGGNLAVNANLTTPGLLSLIAASANSPAPNAAGSVTLGTGTTVTGNAGVNITGGTAGVLIGGSITSNANVNIAATGSIGQASGVITAASLTGSSGSFFNLGGNNQPNQVATLGNITAGGTISYSGTTPVTVTGTLNATGFQIQIVDDQINFASGASLNAGFTGSVSNNNNNVFLSPFANGDVQSISGGPVSVIANVLAIGAYTRSSTRADIVPVSTTVSSTLNVGGGEALLQASGPITESGGGAITAARLVASGGSISLGGANAFTTIGTISATSGVSINLTTPSTIAGPVIDQSAIAITSTASIGLLGNLQAPSISLVAGGAITQSSGVITTGTLGATANGALTLTSANSIGSIAPLSGVGTVAVSDTIPLTIGRPITATGPTPVVVIADDAPNVTSSGSLIATGGTVQLTPFTTGGTTTLAGLSPNLSANTLIIGAANAGNIVITGPISAGQVPTLEFLTAGSVTETGSGLVTATNLTGQASSAALTGANAVVNLGSFSTAAGFTLANAAPLKVTGPVSDIGAIALRTQGPLTIAGTLAAPVISLTANTVVPASGTASPGSIQLASGSLTATNSLTLNADSSIGENTTTLSVGTLTGRAGATVSLTGTNNTIATLGAFSSVGGFSLIDDSALAQMGILSDSTAIALTAGGNLTLGGTLSALNNVALASGGSINQTGGSISTQTFNVTAAGSIALPSANAITTLGAATASAGDFLLQDNVPLTIFGAVSALGNQIVVRDDSTTIGANAVLTVGTTAGTNASGQPIAVFLAPAQSGDGQLILSSTSGQSVIAPLVSLGSYVDASGSTIAAQTLLLGSALNVGTGTTVRINATGVVSQNTTGGITAGTLTSAGPLGGAGSTGSVSLTAGNAIGTLGPVTTANGFVLANTTGLSIGGGVSDGTSITIATVGDLAINANLSAPLVTLTSSGAITQPPVNPPLTTPNGTITTANALLGVGTLNVSGTNGVSLGQIGNQISTLGTASATAGTITLVDASALTVAGPVNAQQLSISGGALTFTGNVTVPSISLASGSVVQSAGTITASSLTGNASQLAQFGTRNGGAVANLGTLAGFTVTGGGGTLALADSQPLTLSGTISAADLAISAPAAVTLANASVQTVGIPLAQQSGASPAGPGSYILVTADPRTGTGQFTQTGTTTITSTSAAAPTVRIQIPDGGTIQFANLAAPTTNLVLGTGTGGSASGTVAVAGLLVIGQGGSTNLAGQVGGDATGAAAQLAAITPSIDIRYLLNGCVIAASSCTNTTTPPMMPVPPTPPAPPMMPSNPMQPAAPNTPPMAANPPYEQTISELFSKSFLRPDVVALDVLTLSLAPNPNDQDVIFPNISSQDY